MNLSITAPDRLSQEEQAERRHLLSLTRDHLATLEPGYMITAGELQREIRCGWNTACSLLEELEKDGELVRSSQPGQVYQAAPAATPPGPGYALPLSSREHAALLRLLDERLVFISSIRATSPQDEPLANALNAMLKAELPTLRAIRSRMKRPA